MQPFLNFFSTRNVQSKISKGTLFEGQYFLYVYLILMFDALSLTWLALLMANQPATTLDLVNLWGDLLIKAVGLIILFIANGGTKGTDFVKKFFSFSFTVGYKYLIVLIIFDNLSIYLPNNMTLAYRISIYFIINFIMVINIALRMRQTKII